VYFTVYTDCLLCIVLLESHHMSPYLIRLLACSPFRYNCNIHSFMTIPEVHDQVLKHFHISELRVPRPRNGNAGV
jgi:hypothetical protein